MTPDGNPSDVEHVHTGMTAAPAEVMQVGLVVRDLEKSMEAYERAFGWGPWNVYVCDEPFHHDVLLDGEPTRSTMRIATIRVGGVQLELIQPTAGPSTYTEFLDRHGEGLHHLLVVRAGDSTGGLLGDLRAQGFAIIQEGGLGGDCRYQYLDTRDALGTIVETFVGTPDPPTYVHSPGA